MNNKENNNRTPELRFPGFTGEWDAPTISDIFEIRNGYTPSKRILEYWEGGTIPWFRMEDIRENGGILADAIQHITPSGVKGKGLFKKNSIILATTATIGIHAMLIADSLANQRFTNFSIRESLSQLYSPLYIYYAFFGIDEWCKKNTNAGGLLSVNMPALLKQPFHTPSLAEQQKIAECLSSLDEEIAAEAQKADALKDHKKGLMQQLFPAISNEQLAMSNCVPQLRFPGFEGEWVVKKLGTVGNVCMCKRILKDETNSQQGIPFYKIGTFGSIADSYISEELYLRYREKYNFPKKGDILISAAGTIGRTVVYDGKPAYFQDSNIVWINNNEKDVLNCFLRYIYSNIKWKTDNGGIVLRLYNESIRSQDIIIPPTLAEQQKIADCLSELDEMISAQQQKVEALKEYKKGLMQKLFPKMSN